MNIFTSHFWRVQAHFGALSARKRAIVLAVAVGVLVAGAWWGGQSGRVEMQPVLDQPLSAAELARISTHLADKGVGFRTEGNKVLVPADRRMQILADLLYADLLPDNTESGFDAMIRQVSIWDSSSKLDKMYMQVKVMTLQNVIGRFPGVRKATVIIDASGERHLGGGAVTPSALVDIQTRGDVPSLRQLATAAVNAVTGAQSNLPRDKVQVTIDGVPYRADEEDIEQPADYLARRQELEQMYVSKVRQQLAFIPDVLVSVTVDLWEPSRDRASAPELLANTGATVAGGRVEAVTSASIAVPRSYFVSIYKRINPKMSEPADALIQPIVDSELDKVRKLVRSCLALRSDDDVIVETYYDLTPVVEDGTELAAAPIMVVLQQNMREVGIGAAVLLGIVVLSVILRRGLFGASPAKAMLGMQRLEGELERLHRAEQQRRERSALAVERVRETVRMNPDSAASLVQRWIQHS